MEIPVLIESVNNNGFRARSGEPLPLSADGTTREEAIQNLRQMLADRLKNGGELISLTIAVNQQASLKGAGIYREDDPIVQEWLQIMEENRRKLDEDEGIE